MPQGKKPTAKPIRKMAKPKRPAGSKKEPSAKPSHYADWVDKQDIKELFHISDRTLQNLRSNDDIPWSRFTPRGKIFYNKQACAEVLDRNRRG